MLSSFHGIECNLAAKPSSVQNAVSVSAFSGNLAELNA
jgi:hypothetical protein